MLTSEAQKTVLVISSYWINLLFITGDAYHKMLKLKAYSDTLKKPSLWYFGLWKSEVLPSPHALTNL